MRRFILTAAAFLALGVCLGYGWKTSPQNPLKPLVAASSQIFNNPASIITSAIQAIVTYPITYRKPTKYRIAVAKTLDDFRLEIDQVTLSYRAYQRLWLDVGYSAPQKALLLGVSWEF
jgi:hypothetical protein